MNYLQPTLRINPADCPSPQPVCPICGCRRLSYWGQRNGYSVYRCIQCAHCFADLQSYSVLADDPDDFRRRFTHQLMETDEVYYRHLCRGEEEGEPSYSTAELILSQLQNFGCQKALGRWLDIGSGSGYLVHVLQQQGWDAYGIEPGGWGQIAAREKGIRVVQGFLNETIFSGTFNFVSATDVLEHQPDPRQLLRLIRRYLSESGVAFLTVPFVDSFHGKFLKCRWDMVEPPTHCHFFSRLSFETLTQNCGFEVLGMIQYNQSYPPVIGKLKYARKLFDRFLSATFGGDQALFIVRRQPGE